jgi:Ca-activated chloride channel homolog
MKKRPTLLILLAVLLFLISHSATAGAQDILPPPLPPIPPDWNTNGLRIEYQRVNVTINNQIATTHIDQLFVNEQDWLLEGVYLFPLPAGAAVSQLTMWVDGQAIEAKILEKAEARQIYDAIVRQLRDPALLEYVGTSAIQANVFPIPPRSERRIEIEYQQLLTADNGLFHFIYPQSTHLYTNAPLANQSIRVEVSSNEAIRAIYSPSHPVDISRAGSFRAVTGYEAANVKADQDFELYYSVSPEAIGLNLLSYRESGQDGFFLLLLAPSVEVNANEVVARDIILVIDTSGSMFGAKMEQARQAALYVVDHLNEQDRFNIITFSTGVRSLSTRLQPAAAAREARPFINSLEAVGGTNISQALLEAVGQADRERPTTILFLTDGLATEGITATPRLLETVKQQTPRNVRIFAFGVGDDVDTTLLDSLAQNHSGTSSYVRPNQQVDEAVSSFYAKVSTPVLANISLDFDGVVVDQMYPATLPDLFAGTQLVLTGRYREGGAATITLRGEVNGREQTFTYRDHNFRTQGGDAFIPRLWATRAIGHLLTQIRLHGEEPELVQSIVNLSLRYGIITPYTSYLIEEDDIFSQTGRETIVQESLDASGAPAPVSGAEAVDTASSQRQMAEAEAPLAMPTMAAAYAADGSVRTVEETVKLVGSKTFVLRDGVWMDTAYDRDSQTPQVIEFAGDAYFDLLTAVPELSQYLAVAPEVLVVHNGVAYQIVTGEGQTVSPTGGQPGAGQPATGGRNEPAPTIPAPSGEPRPAGRTGLCASAVAMPMLLLGIMVVAGRRRFPT